MPEQSALANFRDKFRLAELTVVETEHWVLSVRPEQLTLGAMVLSARAGALTFSDLDAAAGADFVRVLGTAERVAKKTWGAIRINAIALMMKDPVVHFHVLPRYQAPVDAYGVSWVDEDWPGPPVFRNKPTRPEVLDMLCKVLSDELA